MVPTGTVAAIMSTLMWIIAGTISKKISRELGSHLTAFLVVTLSLIPILTATLLVGVYTIPLEGIILAVVAGIFLGIGFILGFKALQTENLSSVSSLTEIQPAVLVLLGLFALGEHITTLQVMSIITVFLGASMILTTEKFDINKKLIPAILSSISWTFYWAIMTYSITNSNTFALPVFISRAIGIPFVIVYLLRDRKAPSVVLFFKKLKRNRTFTVLIALTIIASFADAVGDVLFGITVGSPVLAIGAAIIALSPMMISFFGFVLYKERLTRLQLFGLLIMIIGALALSIL
ncbi:MAG: DMT family transporter [Candidatus Micrarchaeota archaeon]|nr:DMT family transporter [Candidatus Micrarchaeota archaeon]MDE1860003.1 DMT family transporter [Candidatus Micrarchaeota archaeon]